MASKNKGQEKENSFKDLADTSRTAADTSISVAAAPSEFEKRRGDHALALDKWRNGESGPIDVRNMPGGGANMALFNDSMKVHDANRVGRGVGSMGGNVNPNFIANRNAEDEMTRHKMASGALEENVNNELNANDVEMGRLSDTATQRNEFTAGVQENRYQSDADRYKSYMQYRESKPNFFKDLAGKWLSPGGLIAAAGTGG
jgi:hypothetical protein